MRLQKARRNSDFLGDMRLKLESGRTLNAVENDVLGDAESRFEADPFGELFSAIETYFNLMEQGHISIAQGRAGIEETAEVLWRLTEIKGIPPTR